MSIAIVEYGDTNMKLVKKYGSKGINTHTIYLYSGGGRFAGINKNHDVLIESTSETPGAFYCFEIRDIDNFSYGESIDTIWYGTHKEARKVVEKYLSGKLEHIPKKNW